MPITNDHAIADVLRTVKTIALLGASPRPERPSHRVMQFLLSQNFEVIPVNPGLRGSQLQGQRVYGSLPGERRDDVWPEDCRDDVWPEDCRDDVWPEDYRDKRWFEGTRTRVRSGPCLRN